MKVLIWDFDGTIAYREGMWSGTLVEILDDHRPGHGWTVEHVRPHLKTGFPWHDWKVAREAMNESRVWWDRLDPVFVSAFTAGCACDSETAASLAGLVRKYYLKPEKWKLFDDSLAALDRLRECGWTHVALSNHVPELEEIMVSLGIRDRFLHVFNSAMTGLEKPNPEAFRNVLSKLGECEIAVMIGDNAVADIEGARAVGIPGILVRKKGDCDWGCETLDAIPGVLERIEEGRANEGR